MFIDVVCEFGVWVCCSPLFAPSSPPDSRTEDEIRRLNRRRGSYLNYVVSALVPVTDRAEPDRMDTDFML